MIHERITPAGQRLIFEDGLPDAQGKSKRRTYWLGEQTPDTKLPSITTVLNIIDNEGLHIAIERLAVKGAVTLATSTGLPSDSVEALEAMKAQGLSFRQVWGRRADKGTDIHDYFEKLLLDSTTEIPVECEPFAQAILEWQERWQPEPIQSETMVCSPTHRFAGRFDLLARIPHPQATVRVELKSTDRIKYRAGGDPYPPYTEHLWQLAAQEIAACESGDPTAELQAVLRVDEEGDWDFHVTQVEPRGFLATLALYRALRGIPEPNQQLTMEAAA